MCSVNSVRCIHDIYLYVRLVCGMGWSGFLKVRVQPGGTLNGALTAVFCGRLVPYVIIECLTVREMQETKAILRHGCNKALREQCRMCERKRASVYRVHQIWNTKNKYAVSPCELFTWVLIEFTWSMSPSGGVWDIKNYPERPSSPEIYCNVLF